MPPQHDAFGRPIAPSGDPSGRSSAASEAFAAPPPPRAERPAPHDRRRPPWRLPYLLALLLIGAGAIGLTLSAAADWAADQPRTHEFALERDPFGPRSLLRAENLRRATDAALDEAHDDERVAGLLAQPHRVTVTLTDPRDQSRWIHVDTAFSFSTHDLGTSSYPSNVAVDAMEAVDPAPAVRALRRHWRANRPYARDPTMSMVISSGLFDDRPSRVTGWLLSIDGVAQDEKSLRVTVDGKAVR